MIRQIAGQDRKYMGWETLVQRETINFEWMYGTRYSVNISKIFIGFRGCRLPRALQIQRDYNLNTLIREDIEKP